MKEECFFTNHKGMDCIIQPVICQEGLCGGCQVYKDWVGHERTMGRLHGSINPEWQQEWEKEQSDKIAILRRQIRVKRDEVFNDSLFGNLESQTKAQVRVDTYDVVLNLIKEMLK